MKHFMVSTLSSALSAFDTVGQVTERKLLPHQFPKVCFWRPAQPTQLGDHSFAAAGTRLWNSLPGHLHQSETLAVFKRQLKTFLFSD